tara:strand:- start:79 stop:1227 length:1149 start_codon:yes stop_codon:yes gene_type:complete
MKKICFIHPSSELYGADKILIYVMKNYFDYQKVLILRSEGPLVALVQKELPDVDIRIIPSLPIIAKKNLKLSGVFKFLLSLFTFPSKIKDIRKENPDIVYLNTLAVLPMLFYFSSSVKKVIHIHEILKNDNFLHRSINKIALIKSDILICVSKAVKNNMEFGSGLKKDKLKLINNGISFKKNIHDNLPFNIDKTKTNFVLIGRIKPSHKGQNLLIEAISKLNKAILENAHFFFVGSTVTGQEYMLDEVKNYIKILNLNKIITIIPFVENIEIVYKNIDVVIVPSVFDDPFPTTVLEGMFFSKPIIGTNVGGIPEMIEDEITGFISERDSITDLSNKIKYFIEFPGKIIEMGKKGNNRFMLYYSEKSFNERYRRMIEKDLQHD